MTEPGLNTERLKEAVEAFVDAVKIAMEAGRNGSLSLEVHHAGGLIRKADIGGVKRLTF